MKAWMLGIVLAFCCAGCGGFATITPDRPFGKDFDPNGVPVVASAASEIGTAVGVDPNEINKTADIVRAIGETLQITGAATGNAGIAVIGTVAVSLAGFASLIVAGMKRKKEDE